ncbi:MAG: pyridoxal-phosphate dependent enzyme [Elioraea sp.]|nr:pyridoxal-phosphate dependent enzyme [Elioraea sp.]
MKVRGSLAALARLARERPDLTGIISATRGNHGQWLAFAIIRAGAARIVTVTDDEIAEATRALWTDTHNLAEGAGAAAFAALIQERAELSGKRAGTML